ncbi:hypothetical protein L798_13611 [Zootermopsis nevadensis]|uniref:Uncharacterized protein n=1 Tax=Zootermopsis nevadensis TaxID=136037 RepID=A0A067QQ96_ZOONE|nr:hypothetical protein L798_13611 [Zootermopsis nevadensis]
MTFRRLILTVLIRAQKPLQVTLGKLLPLSIELFALILNISYKIHTVLLKLHES